MEAVAAEFDWSQFGPAGIVLAVLTGIVYALIKYVVFLQKRGEARVDKLIDDHAADNAKMLAQVDGMIQRSESRQKEAYKEYRADVEKVTAEYMSLAARLHDSVDRMGKQVQDRFDEISRHLRSGGQDAQR